jgi:FtsP/CotA-like multicopper oxidase with cupredoxin domain
MAPDGFEKLGFLINGQYPGPTLEADWGDTIIVNVKNSLQHNGTSMHWHGVRMLNSCQYDGVNGVTECPIPPGGTVQYRFRCTQHGTSWYHSHFSAQYGEGVVGALLIHGPASQNYDHDLGPMTLTDWFHETIFALNIRAIHSTKGPPVADTGLINCTMKGAFGGRYHVTTLKKDKKHRLRLINTGIDNNFHVSIDSHNFTVITSDFVPVKPYTTSSISINIGQRYDIIINANQAVGNYWLRADVATKCGRNRNPTNIKSIIRYEDAPEEEPTTQNTITKSTACYDESVVPCALNQVPKAEFRNAVSRLEMDFNMSTVNGPLIQWLINGSDTLIDWSKPTLEYVQDGNFTFEDKLNVFEINKKDEWVFWYIQAVQGDPISAPHPMHQIHVSTALLLNSIRKSLANTLIQGHGKPFAISLL